MPKIASKTRQSYEFAVRRLVRTGSVKKNDIMEGCDCSPSTASLVINKIKDLKGRNGEPYALTDRGRLVLNKALNASDRPSWAGIVTDAQLKNALTGEVPVIDTGLFKDGELPIKIHTFNNTKNIKEGLLTELVSCFISQKNSKRSHRSALKIHYVGLRRNEQAIWRTIFPIGLECVLGQWRIIAHDLGKEDYPLRSYVLLRVLDFEKSIDDLPVKFKPSSFDDSLIHTKVKLNPALTDDQMLAIKNELDLSNDCAIDIPKRVRLDILRRYTDQVVSDTITWPPISLIN